jgi:uncharacterized protein (DUF983 family)
MTEPQQARKYTWWQTFVALLRERCPRCHEGAIFKGRVAMNDPCPVCGLIFQREEGYFLGAMYVSYGLGCAILVPLYFAVHWLLPDWNGIYVTFLALVPYLLLMPAVFRYSRVVWIYFERSGCPTDVSATVYEKARLRQLREQGRAGRSPMPPASRE